MQFFPRSITYSWWVAQSTIQLVSLTAALQAQTYVPVHQMGVRCTTNTQWQYQLSRTSPGAVGVLSLVSKGYFVFNENVIPQTFIASMKNTYSIHLAGSSAHPSHNYKCAPTWVLAQDLTVLSTVLPIQLWTNDILPIPPASKFSC